MYKRQVDKDMIYKDTGECFPCFDLPFSIILGNQIIYHGLTSFIPSASGEISKLYKDFPVIRGLGGASDTTIFILAIKPKLDPIFDIFRDYSRKEQKKILNEDVYEYFKSTGKLIEGKIDLKKFLEEDAPYILDHKARKHWFFFK